MKHFLFLLGFLGCITSPTLAQVDSLAIKSGQNLFGIAGETLADSIIVTAFNLGVPVQGASVNFKFNKVPGGASGHSLSDFLQVTNSKGNAGILVTLGSESGVYEVEARSENQKVVFNLSVFALSSTVLKIQREINRLVDDNNELIVLRQRGISKNHTTFFGVVIPFSDIPDANQILVIDKALKRNYDAIKKRANRARRFLP